MTRLFNNTLVSSMDFAVLIVLNLIATPLLIDRFGVEGYGAFVALSMFSIYGALQLFDLGLESALMNYVARFEAEVRQKQLHDSLTIAVVYYAVLGGILGSALYAVSATIAAHLLSDSKSLSSDVLTAALLYVSVTVLLQFLTIPFTAVLQGLRRFTVTKTVSIVLNILKYTLLIAAAIVTGRIDVAFGIVAALTAVRLVVLICYFLLRVPQFRGYRPGVNTGLMRSLFGYSSTLFVSRVVGLLWNQTDKVLIWLYLAVTHMTIYDVVVRPSMLPKVILGVLNSATIPEVARRHQLHDTEAIRGMFINLLRYAYLLLVPGVVVLYVYMDVALELWVGAEFAPYSYMAMILLTVNVLLPIPSVSSTLVIGLEKVKQTIWIPVAATIINVGLSILLLKQFGLVGLFIATLAAEVFAVIPYLMAMRRFLQFEMRDVLSPVARILGTGAVFAMCHIAIRALLHNQWVVSGLLALCLLTVHYWWNWKRLTSSDEKSFVADRVHRYRRHAPMAPLEQQG